MKILFCNTVILVVACVTVFLLASILWQKAVAVFGFEAEDEPVEDDTAAWDRGHDEYIDREMGVA